MDFINRQDISKGGEDLFWDDILSQVASLPGGMIGMIEEMNEELIQHPEYELIGQNKGYREIMNDEFDKGQRMEYLQPNRILLLNFN